MTGSEPDISASTALTTSTSTSGGCDGKQARDGCDRDGGRRGASRTEFPLHVLVFQNAVHHTHQFIKRGLGIAIVQVCNHWLNLVVVRLSAVAILDAHSPSSL